MYCRRRACAPRPAVSWMCCVFRAALVRCLSPWAPADRPSQLRARWCRWGQPLAALGRAPLALPQSGSCRPRWNRWRTTHRGDAFADEAGQPRSRGTASPRCENLITARVAGHHFTLPLQPRPRLTAQRISRMRLAPKQNTSPKALPVPRGPSLLGTSPLRGLRVLSGPVREPRLVGGAWEASGRTSRSSPVPSDRGRCSGGP